MIRNHEFKSKRSPLRIACHIDLKLAKFLHGIAGFAYFDYCQLLCFCSYDDVMTNTRRNKLDKARKFSRFS